MWCWGGTVRRVNGPILLFRSLLAVAAREWSFRWAKGPAELARVWCVAGLAPTDLSLGERSHCAGASGGGWWLAPASLSQGERSHLAFRGHWLGCSRWGRSRLAVRAVLSLREGARWREPLWAVGLTLMRLSPGERLHAAGVAIRWWWGLRKTNRPVVLVFAVDPVGTGVFAGRRVPSRSTWVRRERQRRWDGLFAGRRVPSRPGEAACVGVGTFVERRVPLAPM